MADADLRLEWANKHIENFEREIQAFHATQSYRLVKHFDPQNPNLWRITEPPAIPPQLNLISSDAVHSMRVALDYLACSLALLNNRTMSNVYFPVAVSADEYRGDQTQGKIKKLSADAKAFIDGLKPYKGGNNLLWAVNEINKTDKHRNLVFLGETAHPMWYFTPRQDENARDPVTSAQQHDFKLTLVPGFADLEGFENESALTLLKQFLGSVSDVLREARRLFFPGTSSAKIFP